MAAFVKAGPFLQKVLSLVICWNLMKQDVSQIVPLVLLLVLISWPLSLVRVLLLLAYVSCFWLLCALRGNASADNYFFCQLLLYLFYYIVSVLPNSSMHCSLLYHIPRLQGTKSTLYSDRRVVKEMHQHNISLSGNCHIPWWLWLLGEDSNISGVKTFIVNHALIQSPPVMLLIGNSMQCFNTRGQLEAWEF